MLASCISPRADTDQDNVAEAVEALKTLQRTLHLLTPRDQSDVKRKLPFATSEWLEGLALSIRAQAESADGKNVDSMHAGNAVARLLEKETADAARIRLTPDTGKIVIVLVGLPARGKSMLCHKMEHFLTWHGYLTKSFRVGQMRRAAAAGQEYSGASFFDSSKAFATATREELTQNAFDELISWLTGDGAQIAIFDASNVTIQRRAKLQEKASKAKLGMIFIETICTDEAVIEREMLWKVKHSADFADMDQASAMKDLQLRIANYEKIYQYVREEEGVRAPPTSPRPLTAGEVMRLLWCLGSCECPTSISLMLRGAGRMLLCTHTDVLTAQHSRTSSSLTSELRRAAATSMGGWPIRYSPSYSRSTAYLGPYSY